MFINLTNNMHGNNINGKPMLNSYPTRSLREYLAYQSVQNS